MQTDLLDRMGFVPNMNSPLSEMDSNYFKNDVVGTVNGCIQIGLIGAGSIGTGY